MEQNWPNLWPILRKYPEKDFDAYPQIPSIIPEEAPLDDNGNLDNNALYKEMQQISKNQYVGKQDQDYATNWLRSMA